MNFRIRNDGLIELRETVNGQRKSFYGKTEMEAMQKYCQFLQESNYNTSLLFQDYTKKYITTFKQGHIKDSSYDRIDSIYRNHIYGTALGKTYMQNLNAIDVQEYINVKAKDCSASTTKKVYELIKMVLKYSYNVGEIKYNIAAVLSLPDLKPTKKIRAYTTYERQQLENYIMNHYDEHKRLLRIAPIYVFALHTGLRASELLALSWDDIKDGYVVVDKSVALVKNRNRFENMPINVQVTGKPKTKNSIRKIPLNDKAIKALLELKIRSDHIETNTKNICIGIHGEPYYLRSLQKNLKNVCEAANVEYLGVHALRHTFATELINNGATPKNVSELLGHSSMVFTMDKYVHSDMSILQDTVNLIGVENGVKPKKD